MTYSELTINNYLKIKEILKESIENNDDELLTQTKIISTLFDMNLDDVLKLSVAEYQEYSSQITFLLEELKPVAECPKEIIINNKKYVIDRNIKHLSAGQYIDFQSLTKLNDDNYLGYILAIFLIPKGKEYNNGYDIADVADDISNYLDIQTAMNMFSFFQKASLSSISNSLLSLEISMRMRKMMMWKKSQKAEKQLLTEAIQKVKLLRNGLGQLV